MLAVMRAGWDQGFRAFKIRMDWGPLRIDADPAKDRAMVRLCSGSLPAGTWLGFDANRGYSVSTAIRQGRVLEELGVAHFEEPLPSHDRPGVRAVAAALDIPVSTGENEHDRWAFRDLIALGDPDILQPDILDAGGISEVRRIAQLAAIHGKPVMPHSPATGILLAASTQLYATLPGAVQPHELSTEYGPTPEQLAELLGPSVVPHDGTITLTDAPGLGLELDERVLARLLGPADGAVSFATAARDLLTRVARPSTWTSLKNRSRRARIVASPVSSTVARDAMSADERPTMSSMRPGSSTQPAVHPGERELVRRHPERDPCGAARAPATPARSRTAGAPAGSRSPRRRAGTAGPPRRPRADPVLATSTLATTVPPGSTVAPVERQVTQRERRVGQPEPERPQRSVRTIDVVALPVGAATRRLVGVVDGHLADAPGDRHGQPAAGRGVAEQHVRDGARALVARAPRRGGSRRTIAASRGMASGRPETSTSTTGVPVATTAATSSDWRPGRPRSSRSRASPDWQSSVSPDRSPTTTIATSAPRRGRDGRRDVLVRAVHQAAALRVPHLAAGAGALPGWRRGPWAGRRAGRSRRARPGRARTAKCARVRPSMRLSMCTRWL